MSKRVRHYVVSVVTVLLAFRLTRIARAGDWGEAQLYGVAAGLILVIGAVGLPWIELARDGAFRRRPHG
jgi:hypothetical protein